MTLATSAAETITNAHHTADFEYLGNLFGPVAFGTSVIRNAAGGVADARDPYNGFIEPAVTESASVQDQMIALLPRGDNRRHFIFLNTCLKCSMTPRPITRYPLRPYPST
jgi:hypothetical protein